MLVTDDVFCPTIVSRARLSARGSETRGKEDNVTHWARLAISIAGTGLSLGIDRKSVV